MRWRPDWLQGYNRQLAGQDGLAAVIVTLMLIPQSLAYAMLAAPWRSVRWRWCH